jgi:hypothetical protein
LPSLCLRHVPQIPVLVLCHLTQNVCRISAKLSYNPLVRVAQWL